MLGKGIVHLGETVEDDFLLFLGDADSGVDHAEHEVFGSLIIFLYFEDDRAARRELYRIIGQVEQYLENLERIADPLHHQERIVFYRKFQIFLNTERQDGRFKLVEDLFEAERLGFDHDLAGVDTGKFQDIVENFHELAAGDPETA